MPVPGLVVPFFLGGGGSTLTYRGVASNSANGLSTSLSVTVSGIPGIAANDLLVAITSSEDDGTHTASGWTSILTRRASLNGPEMTVWWRLHDGASSSYSFGGLGSNTPKHAAVLCLGPTSYANPVDASSSVADTGTALDCPSVTATVSSSILLALVTSLDGLNHTYTAPTGMTEVLDTTLNGHAIGAFYEVRTATGATGTRTVTASVTTDNAVAASVLMK